MKKVHSLRNKGYAIRADEEEIKTKLEEMLQAIQKPTIFKGRLNELYAQMQHLIQQPQQGMDGVDIDEESFKSIYQVCSLLISRQLIGQSLAHTQEELLKLQSTAISDKKELGSIQSGYTSVLYKSK